MQVLYSELADYKGCRIKLIACYCAAMVWLLDQSIGNLVQALSDKKMLENSIIIFSSDNGGAGGGYNFNVASNWPLRGGKDTVILIC